MIGQVDAVSVILPNYNHALFLHERIETVLSQVRPYDEIIFLDDASTDDSVAIAKDLLQHAPCKVIYDINTLNSGSPFCQWNKGFNHVSKNWIWIAETDDSCHPDFLKRVLGAALQNGSDFAYAQSYYVDEQGVKHFSDYVRMNKMGRHYFDTDFTKPGLELVHKFFSKTNCIPNASAVVFNASLLKKVGYANESFYFTGDWEFWIRLVMNRNVSFVAEELNYFRFHPATTRAIKRNRKRDVESLTCQLLAKFFRRYPHYVGEKQLPPTHNNNGPAMPKKKFPGQFIKLDQVPTYTSTYVWLYTTYIKLKSIPMLPSRFIKWVQRKMKMKEI